MRRFMIAFAASVIFCIGAHLYADAADDFYGAPYHGGMVKVFPRGWPVKYVFEGEFKDSDLFIILKILANFLICGAIAYFLMFSFGKLYGRKRKVN